MSLSASTDPKHSHLTSSWSKMTFSPNLLTVRYIALRNGRSVISRIVFGDVTFLRIATPRDFIKQSASPWNYWTFGTFRSISLGCITRRKGIKSLMPWRFVIAQGFWFYYVFQAVRRSFEFVTFDYILSVTQSLPLAPGNRKLNDFV